MPVPEEIITLREAARKSGLSESHLRSLARSGRLNATKVGRDWVTTAEDLDKYLVNEELRSRNPYKSGKRRRKKP